MREGKGEMRLLAAIMLLSLCTRSWAQGGVAGFVRRLGALVDTMSVSGLDRRYIGAPARPWQVIAKGSVNQGSLSMTAVGSVAGFDYKARPHLRTEPSEYVGLWAGYRGYGLGYTVNVGGDKGRLITLGATGGAYGVNVRIHTFENNTPNFDIDSDLIPEDDKDEWRETQLADPIKVRTVFADAYYLFNGRRFSYAAAYDQSVLQLRSAGSLVAGAAYYYGRIGYAAHSNADLIYLMHGLGRVRMWQAALGVGYAYNWVPAKGLLVSAMAMPMVTFVNRLKAYGYATNVDELMADPNFLDDDISDADWDRWWYSSLRIAPAGAKTFNSVVTLNLDARLSVTYNFGRYFAGAYGQFNNMRYRHLSSHGHLSEWFVNAAVGVRL